MASRTRLLLVGLTALVALGVGVGVLARPAATTSPTVAPESGHVAPDFTFQDVSGRSVSLQSLRGHVVLLDFFATWCIPCRQEMPLINEMYRTHHAHFAVLAVDKQEPASDVASFVRDLHLAFDPVIDASAVEWQQYRLGNLQPVSFWIDRAGVIRSVHYGPMDRSYIQHELTALGVA